MRPATPSRRTAGPRPGIWQTIAEFVTDTELVVGGFSMGGLITRYALAKLETGNRYLGFDTESGFWHRLWQHRGPRRLHAGKAMFLRPADVDQIIKIRCSWIAQHRGHQRTSALTDEIATGAKQLVIAFAGQAGAGAGGGFH
ncbi:hypothetical protein [Catenulispora pinisilvae]|uniref:hypothetical protein n=1 Tax=Catenulispora pinisilvae TaxID=2705253 RepID=UPI0018923538|nr:hypothetical protein [Catenulispora pinisilvae]